jgi:KaiC/GvpD/RAD55 family RecA-like ATPase/tetratricopeptide (TPR) repeat protein
MDLVKKAEPYVGADRLEGARVLFTKGRVLTLKGDSAQYEIYGAALLIFEEEYSLWDVAWALIGGGSSASRSPQDILANYLRSIALFEELGDFRWQMESCNVAGFMFVLYGLEHEALELLAKVAEIDEKMKMGDYLRLVYANASSARAFEFLGDYEKALDYGLKALEYSRKTDSLVALSAVCRSLIVPYSRLGEIEKAEEYFEKFRRLPPDLQVYWTPSGPKSVFYAAKSQWEESEENFKECFAVLSSPRFFAGGLAAFKALYAWALEKQGRFEEAKVQLEESQKIRREVNERFEKAFVQASLMVHRQAFAGEEFELRLDLVNVSRARCLLTEVKGLVPAEFEVTNIPVSHSLNNGIIVTKEAGIDPFQVKTIKLRVKSSKAGTFSINPEVAYVDEKGEAKNCKPTPRTVIVQLPQPKFEVLPGRITTGFAELDALLFGGIPQNYAVALTSPSNEEREMLSRRFLEAGATAGETTFYVTVEPGTAKALAEKYPSSFYLILCNIQADLMIEALPNVFKLKGTDNLTDIDITLTKYLRTLDAAQIGPKRACIDLISDVLLQHHAVITRKWLSSLLANLKSKGFTVLAVINPQMHPQEEAQAILGLFDGEIRISEKEATKGRAKVLQIRRLHNQKYLEDELMLTKEKLEE